MKLKCRLNQTTYKALYTEEVRLKGRVIINAMKTMLTTLPIEPRPRKREIKRKKSQHYQIWSLQKGSLKKINNKKQNRYNNNKPAQVKAANGLSRDNRRKPAPRRGNDQVLGQVIPTMRTTVCLWVIRPRDSQTESRECRARHMLDYLTNGPEVIMVRKSTTNNRIFFIKECFQFKMMQFLHKSLGETLQ